MTSFQCREPAGLFQRHCWNKALGVRHFRHVENTLKHWPEYLMEAAGLAAFMLSACSFTVLLEHPQSAAHRLIGDPNVRRALMGIAMGLTNLAIIFSPLGKRSGAHLNPSVTLSFLALGKIARHDAVSYVLAQFAGGVAGVAAADLLLGGRVRDMAVHYAATLPAAGVLPALLAEFLISALMMLTVLVFSNRKSTAPYTPFAAATLVAAYITFEAPVSGMSMNPARTLGSAVFAHDFTAIWLYFVAPPIGMFVAGRLYTRLHGARVVHCAKFHHNNNQPCIFRCRFDQI
jgi:aquaporin Z